MGDDGRRMKKGQQMNEDGQLLGGDEVEDGCWSAIVEDVRFEDGSGRVLLMASVDIRKKRKYMFCVGNYHL